jgi:galactan endo-1,6-beta-galactosidase
MPNPVITLIGLLISVVGICVGARAEKPDVLPPVTSSVKIDPTATLGVWVGGGTSLAWWAKDFGHRDDIADWLFTTGTVQINGNTLPGLGMTIARYNAGACSSAEIDGRRMVVSRSILPFRQLDTFWLDGRDRDPASASWDWSADANQRGMLQKARDRGANRFELFFNSPPWWMCVNDNPSGGPKGNAENLRADMRESFAYYIATIARRAADHWGLAFTSVATFNEPSSDYWFANGKQEGAHFSPRSQAEILPLVRAALDRQGLATLALSASDETSYDHAVNAWRIYPPEVRAIVAQVNVHGYQGLNGNRAALRAEAAIRDGKPIWNSEHGDRDADGLHMARVLHHDMAVLRPLAWCYWQPIDGGLGGKGGSGWGFIDANMLSPKLGKVNAKAHVFAQYSRHIRPGMVILTTGSEHVTAAYDAKARKLVVVALNEGDSAREIALDLAMLPSAAGRVSRWLTSPFATERYERLADEQLKTTKPSWTIPAKSVLTVEVQASVPDSR